MEALVYAGIARLCQQLEDPRRFNHRHSLSCVMAISILAVLCDCNSWTAIAEFAEDEQAWLSRFMPLKHGVPSRQTIQRVLARIRPQQMEQMLRDWFMELSLQSDGRVRHLAVDGKAVRGSYEHGWDRSGMAYLVSVFATDNGLVLAQQETGGKGQELEAIRKLLAMLDLSNSMITIDALGCQKDVASMIVQGGGNYCLAVKENQATLHREVSNVLHQGLAHNFADSSAQRHQSVDKGHGRIETRTVWVCPVPRKLKKLTRTWCGLKAIVLVKRQRTVRGNPDKPTTEFAYYILSKALPVEEVARIVRGHWGIENRQHYVLDVTFGEDASRIRGDGAVAASRIRRAVLNVLQCHGETRRSIAGRRRKCARDPNHRINVLAGSLPGCRPNKLAAA